MYVFAKNITHIDTLDKADNRTLGDPASVGFPAGYASC
jgi:hypothetical protein